MRAIIIQQLYKFSICGFFSSYLIFYLYICIVLLTDFMLLLLSGIILKQ